MKIVELTIKKFRHIENQTIVFGNSLTVISGLNGTGKSSILGLAGHVFVSPDQKQKSLLNKNFQTEQKEVFRLSSKYDYSKVYNYEVKIEENNSKIINVSAKTRYIPTEKRLKFDIDGRGNKIKYPVIYLGLKRLFPNADETKFEVDNEEINEINKEDYIETIQNIMAINDEINDVERVKTKNKNYIGLKTDKYDSECNSAGQDNLGQIMTALMSFVKTFKKSGGILLIDELEATLFPGAQINLIDKLYKYSKAYNIQIVFTTHSIEILRYILEKNYDDTKVNFLELKDGKVFNKNDATFDYIKHKINIEAKQKEGKKEITVICEDELASLWVKGLLRGSKIHSKVKTYYNNMNDGYIKKIAESNLKCFQNFIFVLDGDCRLKEEYKGIKNVIFLPGDRPPEVIMYKYLKSLSQSDSFWENKETYFDYNVCFNKYMDKKTSLKKCKNWYSEKRNFFGKGLTKFFTRWKKDNKIECEKFLEELNKKS